jgi:hypothetical protein
LKCERAFIGVTRLFWKIGNQKKFISKYYLFYFSSLVKFYQANLTESNIEAHHQILDSTALGSKFFESAFWRISPPYSV